MLAEGGSGSPGRRGKPRKSKEVCQDNVDPEVDPEARDHCLWMYRNTGKGVDLEEDLVCKGGSVDTMTFSQHGASGLWHKDPIDLRLIELRDSANLLYIRSPRGGRES